jgi:hypothetical protein
MMLVRKMEFEEMHAFRKQYAEQCSPRIANATIPLLGWQNDTLNSCGSGTLVQIGDRHFLLTAAHVVDLASIHNILLAIPGKDNQFIPLNKVRIYTTPIPQGRRQTDADMRDDDKEDVGVIDLSPDIVARLETTRRFVRLSETGRREGFPEGLYMVIGYPTTHLRALDAEGKKLFTEPLRAITALYKTDQPHDSDMHIFLHYPREVLNGNDQLITPPKAKGMSGGGIWLLATLDKPVEFWKPEEATLVAVDNSWLQSKGYVRGTNTFVGLSLIYGYNEDLRPIFDLEPVKFHLAIP